MEKKYRINLILPLCVFLISLFLLNTTTANAENIENNFNVFSPNENYYVELNNPTKIAASNNNLAIFDTDEILFKGNFNNPISVNGTISSFQISNDLIAYIENNSIKLILKSDPKSDLLTNEFNNKLSKKNLKNNFMDEIFLVNNTLYFIINENVLYSITYSNNTLSDVEIVATHDSLVQAKDLYITKDSLFYTQSKNLHKLNRQKELNEISTKDTIIASYNENLSFNDSYIIEYTLSKITIKDIKNVVLKDEITNTALNVGNITDVKIDGNNVYICDSFNKGVVLFDINDLINPDITEDYPIKNVYGSTGDYKTKFNNPTKIKYDNDKIYVYDHLNDVIKDITDTENNNIVEYSLPEEIIDFAVNNNKLFMYSKTNFYIYDIATNNLTPVVLDDITNIDAIEAFSDTVMILSNNTLFVLDLNTKKFSNFYTFNNDIIDFDLEKEGSFIYVYTDNNIDKYLVTDTLKLVQNINLLEKGINTIITDFEIDKNGNIFMLSGNNIAKLENAATSYSSSIICPLKNVNYPIDIINDFEICKDKILFSTSNKNLIYKITDVNFSNDKIVKDIDRQVVKFNKAPLQNELKLAKTSEDTIVYSYLNNLEVASIINKDETVLVFNETNTNFIDKKLVLYKDQLGFIYSDTLLDSAKTPLNYNGKSAYEFSLYMYPAVTDEANLFDGDNRLPIGSKVRVLNSFDDFDNGFLWYEVEYDGNIYYAVKQDIIKDNDVEKAITHMITKSSKIGELVKMHKTANNNSDVLITIKDGETVDILSSSGDFYKVKYNDYTGYILKENLIKSGLTNNQLIAIIISSVTLAVALIIFIITIFIRKNKKAKI